VLIHLVDGTYELFRCFFGAPPSTSPNGREVGAVRGLCATLLSLLRNDDVTHVAVAFDTVIESFRNELFDGYKTSAGIDPNLWNQFPMAEAATRALGITTWSMIEFEADDAIAAFAHRAKADARVTRVLLCSPDKDLCQCVVDDRVVLFDRRRELILGDKEVRAKFGVPPAAIPDLLGLVGDDADGIPGIPGWGMKSAAAALTAYGTVEKIPDDAAKWSVKIRSADSLATSLHEHRKEVALYKKLATLRLDVPLAESIDDIQWRGPNDEKLRALADELGDKKLVERAAAVAEKKLAP
jgi:5'-3' exonuclease